jgi:hypothetical protein
MRTSKSLSKIFTAFSLAVALVLTTTVYGAQEGKVVAKGVKGTVKYSTPGGPWQPLSDGATLPVGATVQTTDGSVVLVLNDKDGIRLAENTTLSLDELTKISSDDVKVTLNLQQGSVVGQVKKISKASHFDVRTPTGLASIRGTDFSITVKPGEGGKYEVTYSCLQGVVVVATRNADGTISTVTLNDKMTITTGSGEAVVVQLTEAQIATLSAIIKDITPLIISLIPNGGTISIGNPITIASPTTPK